VKVSSLIRHLSDMDPDAVVTVIDPTQQVHCHVQIEEGQWAVTIESTGRVVTEQDVS
jgi:hypothetical protein